MNASTMPSMRWRNRVVCYVASDNAVGKRFPGARKWRTCLGKSFAWVTQEKGLKDVARLLHNLGRVLVVFSKRRIPARASTGICALLLLEARHHERAVQFMAQIAGPDFPLLDICLTSFVTT
jgi:hypothetical protein